MFKLQRLEITGFKSFADYTEIVFTGNGITAVVGPNGCGKSNVSDCISWVLGEQRAKSLRGGEMKDVIFQGSRNRKPGGMAEVVLHMVRDEDYFGEDEEELQDIDEALGEIDERAIDVSALEPANAEEAPLDAAAVAISENGTGEDIQDAQIGDGLEVEVVKAAQVGSIQTVEKTVKTKRHWRPRSVALDFAPGEAVSITRRLYLSGESEYQLNGRNCRLRDIQDLFAGTGLSGAHYAIVEQGRIGQILSAKPSDRRNLIEEAAGISKFRTRQRAAEARLESAKSNLSRISDIVSEIDKQANSLRRQAGKTRRFIALQEEFRTRLRELFAAEGRHYSQLIEQLKVDLENALGAEKQIAGLVSESEVSVRQTTEGARAAEEALAAVRREHAESALHRDRAEREHRYQSEQVVALNERLETLRTENKAVEERIQLAGSEIERLRHDEERESVEADASRLLLVEAEKQWSEKVETVRSTEEKLEGVRRALIQHSAAAERFDEIRRQLSINSERLEERSKGLENERKRAELSIEEHKTESTRLGSEIGTERGKLERLNGEKADVLSASNAARETLRLSEDVLKERQQELARKHNRLETLQELEETRAVYFPQVQKLFAEMDQIGITPLGVLADFISVDESAERAVEALFGNFLQAVVVGSLDDASKVREWVRANETGRISTLIVGDADLTDRSELPNGNDIAGLLGASEDLTAILKRIFPREMAARLVDDIGTAAIDAGQIAIDKAGEFTFGSTLFEGGSNTADEKNASLLAFKRELSGLGKAVAKLGKDMAAAEAAVESDRAELAKQEEKIVDLQSLIIKVERGLVALELQEKTNQHEIERAERHLSVVLAEIDQARTESDSLSQKIREAEEGGINAEAQRLSVSDELQLISNELSTARHNAEAEADVVNEKRTVAATSGERRRSVQFALRRLESERDELASRLSNQSSEIEEINQKLAGLQVSIADIASKIASAEKDIELEQTALDAAMAALSAARGISDKTSADLAELNRRSADAMNARGMIEVRQTEVVTELRNLNEKCQQDLNLQLSDVIDDEIADPDLDLETAKGSVDDMRSRLDAFGAINMLAVEELAEAEERLDFLTSQRQDIIDSIAAAEEALQEIKVRSRERFRTAFEAINANFTQFFQELFGGGRGEMTLLESDDILEAGIEIVAQPPGKRLQNILLLSGGEKAMTAISLVLAIFKYRPSPFCLMDEVDAPLDDANVGRFVSKIAEMSEKTQFIVITHNKRTMEAARALYGVTMQEAGVSKIVSVKFE